MNPRLLAVWAGRTLRESRQQRGQSRILVIFALAMGMGCSKPAPSPPELPAGQDFSVAAAMSTNRIQIGDLVDLTLTAVHREGTTVSFPNPAKGKDIIVREARTGTESFPNGLLRTTQAVRLTSMTITNHVIGENESLVISMPGGLQWTNAYPFLTLEVVSALQPGETDIRPAKGGLARWPAPPSRWIWIALAVLTGLAAAFLALRKFLTTPRTFLHLPPPVPPHEIALNALAKLRQKGWIETLQIEPFYVELSGIVRRYLEARFGLRAPERTTEEFIRDALTSKKLSDTHRELVAGFLEQSDLVKFARHAPGQPEMRNALDSAERLVRETMPAPPAPGPLANPPGPRPLAGRVSLVGPDAGPPQKNQLHSPMAQGHGAPDPSTTQGNRSCVGGEK